MFHKARERSPYFHLAIDFGYTLLAGVAIFGFLGWWIDNRYATLPWLTMAGIGLGLAVAFNGLFRRLRMVEEREKAARKQAKSQGPKEPEP